jgi:hypothetical protein
MLVVDTGAGKTDLLILPAIAAREAARRVRYTTTAVPGWPTLPRTSECCAQVRVLTLGGRRARSERPAICGVCAEIVPGSDRIAVVAAPSGAHRDLLVTEAHWVRGSEIHPVLAASSPLRRTRPP